MRVLRSTSIPNGSYFLYTDEGDVLQIRHIDGRWHYLAASAEPAKLQASVSPVVERKVAPGGPNRI